ncbi:MAG: hypothetical protein U0169_03045 [Polyangiaceae bacterium]
MNPPGSPKPVLRRRGEHVDVVLGNVVLLSSAALGTELDFGRMVKDFVPDAKRVLVGGLGFGATARGVLEAVPTARVIVVEKIPEIVAFVRGELAELSGRVLDDPRVELVQDDVVDRLRAESDLDAVLLDVDNGPDWASFRTNARLYAPFGLDLAKKALVPGGLYAVWSGYPADAFQGVLRSAGFSPRIVPFRERGVVRARAYVGITTTA